ncbi:MAG: hypothetical protein JRH08_03930 [Deltaproteobacteria bacterium]|nr:hypothetical protein [Deltaproteobacteria bacterium]MBW1927793.1 hypothetical protein [Deltaproteobacteria bacterium]MBW2024102.1 hypothetical protein [Deltaproteobacteria bacterium]MBW2124848.1 hypothetical protein [Deltaproteobacteria bacterium]
MRSISFLLHTLMVQWKRRYNKPISDLPGCNGIGDTKKRDQSLDRAYTSTYDRPKCAKRLNNRREKINEIFPGPGSIGSNINRSI